MFLYNKLSLKENIKKLKEISNNKIKENAQLKSKEFNEKLDETISLIFKKNELEHVGNNIYSNKTHGELEQEEILKVEISKEIISEETQVILKVKILIKIGTLEKIGEIKIRYLENGYNIVDRENMEEVLTKLGNIDIEEILEERLTKIFRVLLNDIV